LIFFLSAFICVHLRFQAFVVLGALGVFARDLSFYYTKFNNLDPALRICAASAGVEESGKVCSRKQETPCNTPPATAVRRKAFQTWLGTDRCNPLQFVAGNPWPSVKSVAKIVLFS
jgi:hypothetical protein